MATKNKKQNFKGMKESELKKELANFEETIRVIRFKSEGSRSKNVKEVKAFKKQIARVLTEMNKNNNKAK